MTNIAKHPPCTPKCPARGMGCHSNCQDYAQWRQQMETIAAERRKQKEAEQGVIDLKRERKEWLRKRGYTNTGGAR